MFLMDYQYFSVHRTITTFSFFGQPLVKKYTMEKLADIFRVHWAEVDELVDPKRFDWIPGKILRCFFDKDFQYVVS